MMNLKTKIVLALLVGLFLCGGCSSLKVFKLYKYSGDKFDRILNENIRISKDESIIPSTLLKEINKSKSFEQKYKFGNESDPINSHFAHQKSLPNQRLIEAGRTNNGDFIILYEVHSAGGKIKRLLLINKIDSNHYELFDGCALYKIRKIEDLKNKANRCHP